MIFSLLYEQKTTIKSQFYFESDTSLFTHIRTTLKEPAGTILVFVWRKNFVSTFSKKKKALLFGQIVHVSEAVEYLSMFSAWLKK